MPDLPDSPGATGPYRPPPSAPADEGFAPGTLLAGRYRIVAVLGKGGMGVVYRADDLTLGQPVALKFLPPHLADDPDRLARFRKEVAAARRVSHPNVCRVHDIAEAAGTAFLTMEFIDGENLASVVKRLGRVPEEKGVEIARQLCSALAAVHDQGLLHRDLKPVNAMLDGRGRVRLTDFGLAAVAVDLNVSDLRAGTPLYQSPEQLRGTDVTVRSDLFALGLVLYEVFTGKRAYPDAKRDVPPSTPSSHVSGLNPAVERVILRCLEPEPSRRPRSANEVLAGLPGGDPLAAALAAGETPSPQLVADAGEVGLISPRVGLALLTFVLLSTIAFAWLADRFALYRKIPVPTPPEEMARKARALLAEMGYPDAPADAVGWYEVDLDWLQAEAARDPLWYQSLTPRDPGIVFVYRESPAALNTTMLSLGGFVTATNPPLVVPGMAGLRLTADGRLREFYALPAARTPASPMPAEQTWRCLFTAAGLEMTDFRPDTPTLVPPGGCDQRLAWVGPDPVRSDRVVRVEAAGCGGQPTFFRLIEDTATTGAAGPSNAGSVEFATLLILIAAAGALALRNYYRGRLDVRGALLPALAFAGGILLTWIFGRHTGYLPGEFLEFTILLGVVLFWAAAMVLFYLAFEPLVRRRWARRLTAWNRLLVGRWSDPLVGRDVLVGIALGTLLLVLMGVLSGLAEAAGWSAPLDRNVAYTLRPGLVFWQLCSIPAFSFYVLLIAFILFLVLRREWLSWPACALVYVLMVLGNLLPGPSIGSVILALVLGLGFGVSAVVVLARFGLLSYTGFMVAVLLLLGVAVTLDVSAWYFRTGLAAMAALFALAAFCCWTATGRKRPFREGFFGDD
jgi:serine/threonine-protein kinase